MEHVAVEIPSIPQDYEKLITVLPLLDQMKVRYLNLHEYLLMPGDPHTQNAAAGTFILNKHSKIQYDAYSLQNTEKIKRFCRDNKLNLLINNCSLQKKENQMLHRRLVIGKIVKKPYERLTDEGFLQTIILSPDKLTTVDIETLLKIRDGELSIGYHLIHPDDIAIAEDKNIDGTSALLTFVPPMSLEEHRVLIKTEIRVME